MKEFKKVLREIDVSINELILFEQMINAALVFIVLYMALTFFDVPAVFAIVTAVLFFVINTVRVLLTPKSKLIEKKYAPLREKLRTAADNAGKDSPIVDELEYEVTREMKNVGLSLFINPRTLSFKILAVTLISFLIIFSSTFSLTFPDLNLGKKNPDIFEKNGKGSGDFVATQLENSEDIYGNKDVALLGNEELEIKIKPVDFKVSVKEEGEFEKKEFDTIFPKDVVVKESAGFQETIAAEDQELVKAYFKNLAR